MPSLICANCGGVTNTALCDWLDPIRPDGKAHKCYLRYVDDEWESGCAYHERNVLVDEFAKRNLKRCGRCYNWVRLAENSTCGLTGELKGPYSDCPSGFRKMR